MSWQVTFPYRRYGLEVEAELVPRGKEGTHGAA
jgi:hypothetical protein